MTQQGPLDERLDEQLSAFLDGELDAAAEAELRAALAASPELAARLERLRGVDQLLRAVPEPQVAPRVAQGLRERIEAEGRAARQAGRRAPSPRRRWLVPTLAAAAAAAALALAVLPRLREAPGPETRPIARTPEAPVVPEAPGPAPVPETPVPEPREIAGVAPPAAEDLALAMEIESDADLEVIEMLDLLETLGDIESS